MDTDGKIRLDDDLGLELIHKSESEKIYQVVLNDDDHKWIEVFINNRARLYYHVSALEITFTEQEISFDFIHPSCGYNYPSIYMLEGLEKISLWREPVGEKMKIIIEIN